MTDYEKILKHYGTEHQLLKLSEECGELIAAISRFINRGSAGRAQITEETADVLILIRQIKIAFGVENIEKTVDYKIERQLERMNDDR